MMQDSHNLATDPIDTAAQRMDPSAPLPRRTTLLGKLLAMFIPLFALLGGLIVYSSIEAGRIHQDLQRVVEEDRELDLSRELSAELRGAEAWVARTSRQAASPGIVEDLLEHLMRARAIVGALARGPELEDPSELGHQAREDELLTSLTENVEKAQHQVRTEDDWSALLETLRASRREADVVQAETIEESSGAATHLDRQVHLLANLLLLGTICGVLTLVLVAWALRRLVLRPMTLLRKAASRLGSDRGHEPVPILSRDEFGQLTHAFNQMAARLEGHRVDLERRVTERTREIIRTARLADLGTIAAGIAHEINNPLASIAAGVEGLQRELRSQQIVPESTLEYVEIVVHEAHRAREIASRLLRFGREERRTPQPVWLESEVRDVVSMLEFQAQIRSVKVEVESAPNLPPVEGDPAEWRQVFFNVLRNALDATPDRSTVQLRCFRDADRMVIAVRDHGEGFEAEHLDRVFEPFFTTKDPARGTGLGLAIVERIVRQNHGSVRACNWSEGGEIRIELPWPGAA